MSREPEGFSRAAWNAAERVETAASLYERFKPVVAILLSTGWWFAIWHFLKWTWPIGVPSALLFAAAVILLANSFRARNQLRVQGNTSAVANEDKPAPINLDAVQLSATYLQGVPLRLVDIPRTGFSIKGRTFENCDIFGPAIMAPVSKSMIVGCAFQTELPGVWSPVLWPIPDDATVIGVIGLVDCTFKNCRFHGVGIAGSRRNLANLLKATGASSSAITAFLSDRV